MHDYVLDEVDAGSGRIMELRDGGDQPGRMQRGPVTRSFLLTQEAGRGERGTRARLRPLPAGLSEAAFKRLIGRSECCSGVQW